MLLVASCHTAASTSPQEPVSGPALPPASGTVIGILVDESTSLHLRDDQLDKLREIDAALAARNDQIEGESRAGERPPPSTGGRRKQSGMGGGAKGRMAPPPPPGARDLARSPQSLQDERTANNRDALDHAFAILDPDQIAAAKKLLEQHGVPSGSTPQTARSPEPVSPDSDE